LSIKINDLVKSPKRPFYEVISYKSGKNMHKKAPSYILAKEAKQLNRLAIELEKETEIGVDLEADSMFHYHEKICLIQISTPEQNIIVDSLAINDLSPLAPVFSNPKIRKVFHGADYDIRSLYRDSKIKVRTLFDTHIAAKVLGLEETGLAALLKDKLGIVTDKKYQRRDWSKRPLSPAMLAYAVRDTCHLLPLSRILDRELQAKDRSMVFEEECERQARVRPAPLDKSPLFMKFKGARKLRPRDLAVLDSILRLRDDMAKRKDRPPFKILGNEQVMEIAKRKPATKEELGRIRGVSARQVAILGPSILKRIKEALALPENHLPAFPKKTRRRDKGKRTPDRGRNRARF
jgi:ribonuclease D